MYAWFDMTTYVGGVWSDKSGNGATTTFGGTAVTTATQAAGSNGATSSFSYIAGVTTSSIVFNIPPISGFQMTMCTVSRYVTGTYQRIFQTTKNNWLHGHWSGGAGQMYARAWLVGTGAVNSGKIPLTDWLYMCTAIGSATSYTVLVNGYANYTTLGQTIVTPYQDGGAININVGDSTTEFSTFGVTELIMWNRTLSDSELFQVRLKGIRSSKSYVYLTPDSFHVAGEYHARRKILAFDCAVSAEPPPVPAASAALASTPAIATAVAAFTAVVRVGVVRVVRHDLLQRGRLV